MSRSQLARQIGQAAVTVNGAAGVPSRKLHAGDVIVWEPPPVVATEIAAEAIALTIVHEDQWLVVVDKPAGLVVHPAPGHEAGTLVNALLAHCQRPARDRRRAAARDRPPDRQGHLGPAGGGQGRRDDERARRGVQGAHDRAGLRGAGGGGAAGRERADRHVLRARSARAEEVLQPRAVGKARRHQLAPHREVSGGSANGGAARDRADAPGARSPGGARLPAAGRQGLRPAARAIWRCARSPTRWGGRRCTRACSASFTRRPASR